MSLKVASYSHIGTLFGAAMGQEYFSLKYLIFLHSLPPLISAIIIQCSVYNFSSLMKTLYKSLWSLPII